MKKAYEFLKKKSVLMLLLSVVMVLSCGFDVSHLTADPTVVEGTDGAGKHITGDALSTEITKQNSPDLILPDVDDRITKISPYKNPVDQIARKVGRKMTAHGMEYKHYSIDIAPISDVMSALYTENGASTHVYISVSNPDLFNETDTITVSGVKGYNAAGTAVTDNDLMLYVNGKSSDSPAKLWVTPINGKMVGNKITVPTIPADTEIFLLGTAAVEGDVRSYTNASLPTPETGYIQIYKMEVGETTIAQMSLKEVDWGLDDQIELAIDKLRASIERSSVFGIKGKTPVPNKKSPVYTTQGIYWDIDKEFELPENPTNDDLIDMSEYVFTGQSGSNRKILLMGSKFNAAFSKIPGVVKQQAAKETQMHWGLTWSMITTNFGEFAAMPYDMLNVMGRSNEAIVIDPEYLDKWTLIPFGSKDLTGLKDAGLFDGDVNVTTEASSICIRYRNAHCRLRIVETEKVTGITTTAAVHDLAVGDTYDFAATNTIAPANATNKAVTYVSSEPTKASVNASGVVTGLAAGIAYISASTEDGKYTVGCMVTVA